MKENKMRESFEELDLYAYLRVIWKWRWLIAIGVIVATLLSIPASYLVRSYESQGVLRVSEELKRRSLLPDQEGGDPNVGDRLLTKLPEHAFVESRVIVASDGTVYSVILVSPPASPIGGKTSQDHDLR